MNNNFDKIIIYIIEIKKYSIISKIPIKYLSQTSEKILLKILEINGKHILIIICNITGKMFNICLETNE